eukprot:CAMPEP_0183297828 /NCGR_PEP_ID=MMETSP0160_2-20130417/5007_1 /TAXON_ID=2839 ORGANISM="Odontella Sinensis, Strain Grunow 1884" /NCGR_SAMPLE_ID=MMETSP0160_2 /ASSEMBLY_ACC=CAM_ASM_000250 /LENGTH=722 /DNA_ID=CAMNT_0025459723 /DNA_START=120 /DNA_END=2288 /DNA_ORIENTATION=-
MSVALLPLKLLLLALDFLIMALTFGWVKALKKLLSGPPVRSVPAYDDPTHRTHPESAGGKLLSDAGPGIESVYDLSKKCFATYASRNAMGARVFKGWKVPKKVKEFEPEIQWKTYGQVEKEVLKFGAALRAEGLVSAPEKCTLDKFTTPCSLAIFENTCPEWMIAAQGAFSQGVVVTTIYATLGMDAVIDSVRDGVITAIVCNKRSVGGIMSKIKDMPTLKTIIYTSDLIAQDETVDLPASPDGVKVISFEDFVSGGDTAKYAPTPPSKDSCAVIMYTSGSTGKPKGVVLTHSNLVSTIEAGARAIGIKDGQDVYLAYLPLAHIMEMVFEFGCFAWGCTVCYADPKSLTATGSYPKGALETYSPTLMVGVPKIWDVIKKGVQAKVAKSSPVAQFLVNTAFQARRFANEHGYDTPLFKALVFKKLKAAVGGKLRLALSGGGPLNEEVQIFVRTAFGCTLIQGYGLTESCGGSCVQRTDDLRPLIAGAPLAHIEVKLESCPDINDKAGMAYLSTDTRDVEGNKIHGRGEVVMKGNGMALGYYGAPEKTAEVFRPDGFFETGDIGQFMEDGSLRIVDRKKNLVKLKGGEYIATEKMEMSYGNSKFVDPMSGGICCYGDGDMDRPIALMTPSKPYIMSWAKENGVAGAYEEVLKSDELQKAIVADLANENKKAGLSHIEKIVAVALITEAWTPENGCLTAANKLQRRVVIDKFEKEFNATKPKGIF